MACWDILGKVSGLPVCELLGGRFNDSYQLYRAISQGSPDEMAANVEKYVNEGYRYAECPNYIHEFNHNTHIHSVFQLKVGGLPSDDIQRIRAVRAILDKKVDWNLSYICRELLTYVTPVDAGAAQSGRGGPDHSAYVRREHGLEDAPGDARGERGEGPRCVHRAALSDLRRVSIRAQIVSAAHDTRRVHGRHRSVAGMHVTQYRVFDQLLPIYSIMVIVQQYNL